VAEPKNLLSCEAFSCTALTAKKYYDDVGRLQKISISGSGGGKNVVFSLRFRSGALTLSAGTYVFSVNVTLPSGVSLIVGYTSPSTGNFVTVQTATSDALVFTTPAESIGQPWNIILKLNSGTLTNFNVYPMVCTLEDWNKSHDYVPYYTPLKQAIYDKGYEQGVLGAKNLWKNDIIPTINAAGTIVKTSDGWDIQTTTTQYSGAYFSRGKLRQAYGQYNITLSFEFKSDIAVSGLVGCQDQYVMIDLPTTWTKFTHTIDGTSIDNLIFYNLDTTKAPLISVRNIMVRLASDPDDTYAPYAETNFELTQNKFSSSNVAPTENGAGASKAYSTGQYLIHNGELRKATTAIASGAAITDNNTDATTLAEILELNKNEHVSGIVALTNNSGAFDISNGNLDCVINRFTRRISIRFDGVVTTGQIYVKEAKSIITVASGYYGLINPMGQVRVYKDNVYYRAQLTKNTENEFGAFVALENIPVGATVVGYIEWPY
jgi:hypothetical protein